MPNEAMKLVLPAMALVGPAPNGVLSEETFICAAIPTPTGLARSTGKTIA